MIIFELQTSFQGKDQMTRHRVKSQVMAWIETFTEFEVVEAVSVRDESFTEESVFEDTGDAPIAIYGEESMLESIAGRLNAVFGDAICNELREIPTSAWQSAWDEAPASFTTSSFHVILDEDPAEPDIDKEVIRLGKFDAFGNGQHATTRACIDLIEKSYGAGKWQSALDLGTGSGILAIVLAKLGCTRIMGTEISDDLVAAARRNAERNHVKGEWLNCPCPPTTWEPFDVIVSNILIPALYDLLPACRKLLKPQGSLILAGFIEKELTDLQEQAMGFRLVEQLQVRGWLATRWIRE